MGCGRSPTHSLQPGLQNRVLQLSIQHPWVPRQAWEGMRGGSVAAREAPPRLGGEGRLVPTSRWETMPRGTGACCAPGFFQMPAGPQHPGRAELAGTPPVGSVRWLTSKGSPTSSHNIYFPSLDLSQRRKCRANTVGHFLLRLGSARAFPRARSAPHLPLPCSACPPLGIGWQLCKQQTNQSERTPLISSETSTRCCLACGQ